MKTKKTRKELIESGRVWQIYLDADPDEILFEGESKSACQAIVKKNHWKSRIKSGELRIGKLIWEDLHD